MQLNWVDIGLLAALVLSLVLGAWRGLVQEVISLLGWVAAFVAAQWFAADAGARLPLEGAASGVQYAAGFLVVFIAAVFVSSLLAWLCQKLVAALGMRPADRALGALFGVARGVLMLLAVAVVVQITPLRDAGVWRSSFGAQSLGGLLNGLKPVLPAQFGRYLP